MSALLFGSISTVADTSELQRRAFNEAFEAHGLNWNWSRDEYVSMLGSNGGRDRIAQYAAGRGEDVDAAAVHETKSAIFRELLSSTSVAPRPGVAETIERARQDGLRLGFVTTTSADNVEAVLAALEPALGAETFDLVVDGSAVSAGKPDPEVYRYALDKLGEDAAHAVAIEDNAGGVRAATDAGLTCIAFPNENTSGGDFAAAETTVDALRPDDIVAMVKR
ncbi:HAD-IA family hydrolase [Mycolicibacterium sp. BiH015]|uniref:HAD family hydrolase n=1 Tax=Mycolicibacterium sp. BiH015 TaxID=3018808 RepID=UPI0022E7C031|nr:HAD-IA family hydrolase [Mycolicibacterium sp. BiH015]MDA2892831.1 HAD-IA family hydrolase [Mycolicibacterium sp. BiH015]